MIQITNVSMLEFYNMLDRHDWFYEFSDDRSVCMSGKQEESKIKSISARSPERKALFDAYYNYVWEGGEKPSRPLF